jgi:hypothetical protein
MKASTAGRPERHRFLLGGAAVGALTICVAALIGSANAASSATCGQADHLVFTAVPDNVRVNAPFNVTVTIKDACDKAAKSAHDPVTLALTQPPSADAGGGGTLGGTTQATPSAGVATFSGLTINKSGTGYTLTASYTGLADISHVVNVYDDLETCSNSGCTAHASKGGNSVDVSVPNIAQQVGKFLGVGLTDSSVTVQCTVDGTTGARTSLGPIFGVAPPPGHSNADITVTLTINKFYVGTHGIASIIVCMSAVPGVTYTELTSCPPKGTPTEKCIAKQSADNAGNAVIVIKIDSTDPVGGGFG